MDKLAAFYDLISGLLVAIDVAAPSLGQHLGKWLIGRLPSADDTVNPLRLKTFRLSLFLALLPLSIIISFAIFKDNGATFRWSTVGLLAIGVAIAVIVIFALSLAILQVRRHYNRRHGTTTYMLDKPIFSVPTSAQDATLLGVIWLVFLISGTLALLLLRFATGARVFLAAPILALVLTFCFLPTAMLWNRSLAKSAAANPEKPYYTLARIGLLIFVISKIIYLVVS